MPKTAEWMRDYRARKKAEKTAEPNVPWERGKPMDMETAMHANPNFNRGREFQENCQRCVYAYELRRRGYDVEATEYYKDGFARPSNPNGYAYVMEGQEWVDFTSYGTIKQMTEQMADWGVGARAIVKVNWANRRCGHIFIAEQVEGGTVFLDPQSERPVDIDFYMSRAVKKDTQLSRIDNLHFTDKIKQCAQRYNH